MSPSTPTTTARPVGSTPRFVVYQETCGNKMWKATGGSVKLDKVAPSSRSNPTGSASLSVTGATMAPAPNGAGDAQGSFTIDGTGTNMQATGI